MMAKGTNADIKQEVENPSLRGGRSGLEIKNWESD